MLWEFTDADDANLGFGFAEPTISLMNNGRWAAVFGNGYNSPNARAVLYVLDARTGAPLWSFYAGLPTRTNPMSYEIDGTQYVVMSAGTALFAFALP